MTSSSAHLLPTFPPALLSDTARERIVVKAPVLGFEDRLFTQLYRKPDLNYVLVKGPYNLETQQARFESDSTIPAKLRASGIKFDMLDGWDVCLPCDTIEEDGQSWIMYDKEYMPWEDPSSCEETASKVRFKNKTFDYGMLYFPAEEIKTLSDDIIQSTPKIADAYIRLCATAFAIGIGISRFDILVINRNKQPFLLVDGIQVPNSTCKYLFSVSTPAAFRILTSRSDKVIGTAKFPEIQQAYSHRFHWGIHSN